MSRAQPATGSALPESFPCGGSRRRSSPADCVREPRTFRTRMTRLNTRPRALKISTGKLPRA